MKQAFYKFAFVLVVGTVVSASPAFAGIRVAGEEPAEQSGSLNFGGNEAAPANEGIRQAEPSKQQQAVDDAKYKKGDLLKMADEFRARYERDQQQITGRKPASNEHRYGYVAAFFDTKSLTDIALAKQIMELEKVDGIEFKLIKSHDNLNKSYKDFSKEELERLSQIELPFALDDTKGKIAANYNVKKFPTVMYQTPSGETVSFYVPNTMDAVFRRIRQEARKVDAQK